MRLLPIIIFIIIVINVLRRIVEYNRTRPKTDGAWTEWTAETGDTATPAPSPQAGRPTLPARPTPSERVRQILEQLAQQDETPSLPPLAIPVPPPLPVPRPVLSTPAPPPLPAPRPASAAPVVRRYLTENALKVAAAAADAPPAPLPARLPAADDLYRESLRKAFPPAMAIIRETRSQGRPPFRIRVRGRQSLRQAIVLAEVLGPPRAFDL